MNPIRAVRFAAAACAVQGLIACAAVQEPGPDMTQLSEHQLSCLSAQRPAFSPAHTECVVARYQERQVAMERLRLAVAPPLPLPGQAMVDSPPMEFPNQIPW